MADINIFPSVFGNKVTWKTVAVLMLMRINRPLSKTERRVQSSALTMRSWKPARLSGWNPSCPVPRGLAVQFFHPMRRMELLREDKLSASLNEKSGFVWQKVC